MALYAQSRQGTVVTGMPQMHLQLQSQVQSHQPSSQSAKADREVKVGPGMTAEDFAHFQQPAIQLREALAIDESAPDMGDFCFNSNFSHDYAVPQSSQWNILFRKSLLPFPNELYALYNDLEARTDMGIFQEIGRAWIVIDKRLILWKFKEGFDWYVYDSTEVIEAVGIIKPKKGVFVDAVSYVLVIATISKITLLGLEIVKDKNGNDMELKLYDAALSTPADNIVYACIVGTKDGRIFMGGKDGNVYEIHYSTEETWFSPACYKTCKTSSRLGLLIPTALKGVQEPITDIAIDESRGFLYSLSRKSEISMFRYTGEFAHICTLSNLKEQASKFTLRNPAIDSTPFRIVTLHPISQQESRILHLVAFTRSGARLYFTRAYMQARRYYTTEEPDSPLHLLHVRIPPSLQDPSGNTIDVSLNLSSASAASQHLYLGVHELDGQEDDLYVFAPDAMRMARPIATNPSIQILEWTQTFGTEGKICEIKEQPYISPCLFTEKGGLLNELASQYLRPQRELWVIASQGVHILRKQRPLDTLQQILASKSQHHPMDRSGATEFAKFIQTYDINETLTMAVALICRNSNCYEDGMAVTASKEASLLADQTKKILYEHGLGPYISAMGPGMPTTTVHSARYVAIVTYLARVIRPIWNSKIASRLPNSTRLTCALSSDTLQQTQQFLSPLENLVNESVQHYRSIPRQSTLALGDDTGAAWVEEMAALSRLAELIRQSIEAIAFVMLLMDYNFSDIANDLSENVRNSLANLKFVDLTITIEGREIAKDLVTAMVNKQMIQSMDVDTISQALQMRCGSFCSADDVVLYKAIEHLRRGSSPSTTGEERERSLQSSLDLFMKVSAIMTYDRVCDVCQAYRKLHYHVGAIELALHRARLSDRDDIALRYLKTGLPLEGKERLEERRKFYEIVLDSLKDLAESLHEQMANAQISWNRAFSRALSSDDGLFHNTLYQWMISENMGEMLLDINTKFLEEFLMQPPVDSERSDLLWRYYVRQNKNGLAAMTLQNLALSNDIDPGLARRVEYLSLAATNAGADQQLPGQQSAALYTEINDRLQVARIQVDLKNAAQDAGLVEDVRRLDARLMDVSELYSEFAEPRQMYNICLLILATSDYRDRSEIQQMWEVYVDQIFSQSKAKGAPLGEYVSANVGRLFRAIYPAENVLDLNFLVELLESKAYNEGHSGRESWVPMMFIEAEMPFDAIFEAYENLVYARHRPFDEPDGVTFLTGDILGFLDRWTSMALHSGLTSMIRVNFPTDRVLACLERMKKIVITESVRKDEMIDVIDSVKSRIYILQTQQNV